MSRTVFFSLVLAACSSSNTAPPPTSDAPPADAPPMDALVPDVSAPDVPAPDAPAADAVALDASAPEVSTPDVIVDDDAGSSFALTLSYRDTDCALIEAVATNDGGTRQNEICDRGRLASPRYATVRTCAMELTADAALVRRVADDGAYMNPSRHPERDPPCSRFTVIYPVEQVQRALWCLRHDGRCNDDGSAR